MRDLLLLAIHLLVTLAKFHSAPITDRRRTFAMTTRLHFRFPNSLQRHGSGSGKSYGITSTAPDFPSFCSIGTILPSRPAPSPRRRAQRRSRMARLRATASAARSVLDRREHDGTLGGVGKPITPAPRTIKKLPHNTIEKPAHA